MLHAVQHIEWITKTSSLFFRLNRDAKQNLEMDWSDKKEAHEIDTACFSLRNGHTNKQFHPGAARYQEIQSTPESWAQVDVMKYLGDILNSLYSCHLFL